MLRFTKYHALGNDYLVLNASDLTVDLTRGRVRRICHRNFGVGSDGILIGRLGSDGGGLRLRIFNPDGSVAEKSGNGIRIFCRYLWDHGLVKADPFTVITKSGPVTCRVHEDGTRVTVQMGRVSFDSTKIPVVGEPRDVINEELCVLDRRFRYCAATIGNPHCIVLAGGVSKEEACKYGSLIETDARFPRKTNVQFMERRSRNSIAIEIWERGAGYTLASGSSACAAAATAFRLGLCGNEIRVRMRGGSLDITVGDDYEITMAGPVTKVMEGKLDPEVFSYRLPG